MPFANQKLFEIVLFATPLKTEKRFWKTKQTKEKAES